MANAYFLMVAILQSIPDISNTNGNPSVLPVLVFILGVDALFVLMEDYGRRKSDHISNSAVTLKLCAAGEFTPTTWKEIVVGDIVKVCNREAIPADLLIVSVSEPSGAKAEGICYVETKSLDGETNLKLRQGIPELFNRVTSPRDLSTLRGVVVCEQPNNALERFAGTIKVTGGGSTSHLENEAAEELMVITPKSILLRGCNLRNTDYVYGFVINTGMDTKVFQSASQTPSKMSTMDRMINKQLGWLVIIVAVLCTAGATGSTLGNQDVANHWGLRAEKDQPGAYWVIMFFYYFLLLYQDIPISLYVTMTIVKFIQAYFMMHDIHMYHPVGDRNCNVKSMALTDELGQISHVFTDKTGTLTQNMMTFVRCSIHGKFYGKGAGNANVQHPFGFSSPFVEIEDPAILDDLAGGSGEAQAAMCVSFFIALAVCHTVIIEKTKVGEPVKYSASSPDENALVAAGAFAGFAFAERLPGYIRIGRTTAKGAFDDEFKFLQTLQFTSKRKMMSVIVKPTVTTSSEESGEDYVLIISKGADNVITQKLAPESRSSPQFGETMKIVDEDAKQGYRTLFIAQRRVPLPEYNAWEEKYRNACTNLAEIDKKSRDLPNRIDELQEEVEMGLTLLGSTALEDKLQDGVPDTIASLKRGGTNVWVLTGDKMETAINIGYSCSVLDKSVQRIDISGDRIVENLKDETDADVIRNAAEVKAKQNKIMNVLTNAITDQVKEKQDMVNSYANQGKGGSGRDMHIYLLISKMTTCLLTCGLYLKKRKYQSDCFSFV